MTKVLFLGEIIGLTAVRFLKKNLRKIKAELGIDFVMANVDGASDGFGLMSDTAYQIKNAGVDILTSGDLVYNKKDIKDTLGKTNFLLRPYNLPSRFAGKGIFNYHLENGVTIGVVNLMGRINFTKIFAQDQFAAAENAIERLNDKCNMIIIDFHGGATSEIQAIQWYLAGKVAAVIGTNLKVLTADHRIIDGTAVITGAGFCGGRPGIMGLEPEPEIRKIRTGQFIYSKIVQTNITLEGVLMEIDETIGRAVSIEPFRRCLGSREMPPEEAKE
ncbi:MAG: YmdB family metallophosphoesterase [Spirochaetales bacterium]|nr:YmdB family metallophosphoesterase [Spirochaetales bacterium]